MKARLSTPEQRALVDADDADSLIQGELEAAAFPDERLGKRLGVMLDQFADGTAESVPLACQDWANTKAAYRFFANDRVTEADILAGHFRSTRERFSGVAGTIRNALPDPVVREPPCRGRHDQARSGDGRGARAGHPSHRGA